MPTHAQAHSLYHAPGSLPGFTLLHILPNSPTPPQSFYPCHPLVSMLPLTSLFNCASSSLHNTCLCVLFIVLSLFLTHSHAPTRLRRSPLLPSPCCLLPTAVVHRSWFCAPLLLISLFLSAPHAGGAGTLPIRVLPAHPCLLSLLPF